MEKKNHADKLTVSQTSHFIALKQIVYHFVLVVLTFIFSKNVVFSFNKIERIK